MTERAQDPIFIITGPSGVGKTMVAHALLRRFKRLKKVITHTTRAPRAGEIDGCDYRFVSRAQFEKKLAAHEFFEHANVYGDHYGSAWADLAHLQKTGYAPLFVIDVQGARTLKKKLNGACIIFLAPDSFESLRKRIAARRSSETPEQLARRWGAAADEMKQQRIATHVVINRQGQRGATIARVMKIIRPVLSAAGYI